MKKVLMTISLLFLLATTVGAQNSVELERGKPDTATEATAPGKEELDLPPQTGQKQNAGQPEETGEKEQAAEEARIQIQQQNEGENEALQQRTRSENAMQNMSQVAQRVQELLQNREEDEGIGQQVREVARQQSRAQEIVSQSLEANEKRPAILKYVLGPDHKAVQTIEEQIAENEERLARLQELREEADSTEEELIDNFTSSLEEANSYLEQRLADYQSRFSLLGWLTRLFG